MPSLYFHIPFCHHKCIYCDFYSVARKFDTSVYTDALIRELIYRKDFFQNMNESKQKEYLDSIYFGGGTPSLLNIKDIARVFDTIHKYFALSPDCEITFEANPENINTEYVLGLKQIGINRISLGVQSFEDKDLKLLNRSHTSLLAKKAIEILMDSGLQNISIDLISNLPNTSLQGWKKNLETFLYYGLPHISCYNLMREDGTMLDKLLTKEKLFLLEEKEQIEQMKLTYEILHQNNYIHYETSSFALQGFYSRHNMAYWTFRKYLGLGAGAHSYNSKERFWNIADLYQYTERIFSDDFTSIMEKETLTNKNKYNEYVMLTARLNKGLSLNYVKKNFPEYFSYFSCQITQLIKTGFLTSELCPTQKGWLLQNNLILSLII